jgi:two-component system response regulator YesN
VLVLNGVHEDEAEIILNEVRDEAEAFLNQKIFFVVGEYVEEISDIPAAYKRCYRYLGFDYFASFIPGRILLTGEVQALEEPSVSEFECMEKKVISSIVSMNLVELHLYYNKLVKLIFKMSVGKREDACFYLCSMVHRADERVREILGDGEQRSMSELLKSARNCDSYKELTEVFGEYLEAALRTLGKIAENSDKNVMHVAKTYINEHYAENITLSILAKVVHMNPYYFSTFFKKCSGINYKDYVSRIRIEHALPLLVSTDQKLYEIATVIGFSDARTFSDAFQKIYHETPNEYRKRIKGTAM